LRELNFETIENSEPVDILLNKLNALLVSNKVEDKTKLEKLRNYLKFNPKVVEIDPIDSQLSTLDRNLMGILLSKVEQETSSHFSLKNPHHHYFQNHSDYDFKQLKFPLICKSNQAGGSSSAHKMAIIFEQQSLKNWNYQWLHKNILIIIQFCGKSL